MFIGLLLVTLAHWPNDQNDWTNLGSTFGSIAIALALAVAGALALTWSLPNVPFLNRMVLQAAGRKTMRAHIALSLSHSGAGGIARRHRRRGDAVAPLRQSPVRRAIPRRDRRGGLRRAGRPRAGRRDRRIAHRR